MTIVLPFVLYTVIFDALTKGINFQDPNTADSQSVADKVFKAKAISTAAFIGTIILFWVPMWVWKLIVSTSASHVD